MFLSPTLDHSWRRQVGLGFQGLQRGGPRRQDAGVITGWFHTKLLISLLAQDGFVMAIVSRGPFPCKAPWPLLPGRSLFGGSS